MIKLGSKGTGVISALAPTTNRILKILDPMMFPIAMSALPFFAAVTEVTSSGKDVPKATIVSPINLWLTPNEMASLWLHLPQSYFQSLNIQVRVE